MATTLTSSKTGIIIQARMQSKRLPGKVMLPLAGKVPMLCWVVERCLKVKTADKVIVATSKHPKDDVIVSYCHQHGYAHFRGSETDVLSRYNACAREFGLEAIVRITSDCPFISPEMVDRCIQLLHRTKSDFVHNARLDRIFPLGLGIEVITMDALARINKLAKKPAEREHVTFYAYEHAKDFRIHELKSLRGYHAGQLRLTVDTQADFEVASLVAKEFQSKGVLVDTKEVIRFLNRRPEITAINQSIKQTKIHGKVI